MGKQESNFNQAAVSPAGAIGTFQIMPDTAKALGINPYDLTQNAVGAAKYIGDLYRRFGSWPLAFAAYNAGPGAVEKYHGIPPFPETQQYVKDVQATIDAMQ
jgi:soluble lytic murein transglycosylase-like protein